MSLKRICVRKGKLKCPKIPHCPKIPVMTLVPLMPTCDLGVGSKSQDLTSSEYSQVAYQIKGRHKCSNMVP